MLITELQHLFTGQQTTQCKSSLLQKLSTLVGILFVSSLALSLFYFFQILPAFTRTLKSTYSILVFNSTPSAPVDSPDGGCIETGHFTSCFSLSSYISGVWHQGKKYTK